MTRLTIKHVIRALTVSLAMSFLGWGTLPVYAKGGGASNSHPQVTAASSSTKMNSTNGWTTKVKAAKLKQQPDRTSDQLTQINSKTQRNLTEANDAEAREQGLMSDYKKSLQEMRK